MFTQRTVAIPVNQNRGVVIWRRRYLSIKMGTWLYGGGDTCQSKWGRGYREEVIPVNQNWAWLYGGGYTCQSKCGSSYMGEEIPINQNVGVVIGRR